MTVPEGAQLALIPLPSPPGLFAPRLAPGAAPSVFAGGAEGFAVTARSVHRLHTGGRTNLQHDQARARAWAPDDARCGQFHRLARHGHVTELFIFVTQFCIFDAAVAGRALR